MKITLIIIKYGVLLAAAGGSLFTAAAAEHAENLHSPLKEIFMPICVDESAAEWRF